jgi:hypothetical protein
LGKISPPRASASNTQDWRGEDLDQAILDQIESYLQKIEDEEMKGGLRDVLIKGAKLERYRKKSK